MTLQFNLASEIIAEAQFRGDIEGQDDRYTPTQLLRMLNDSAQKLRLKLTNMGFEWWLEFTDPAALSTNPAATGETFSQQDWPLAAARIYGVHVLATTGLWIPLKPIQIQGIRDYQFNQNSIGFGGFGAAQGMPAAFALQKHPQGVATTETVGKILLAPRPTTARNYRLLYLPVMTPLSSTHTFNGSESQVEWIIWDMVVKMSARDNDARETYKIAKDERYLIEEEFSKMALRTQMAAAMEPRRADFAELGFDGGPRELT